MSRFLEAAAKCDARVTQATHFETARAFERMQQEAMYHVDETPPVHPGYQASIERSQAFLAHVKVLSAIQVTERKRATDHQVNRFEARLGETLNLPRPCEQSSAMSRALPPEKPDHLIDEVQSLARESLRLRADLWAAKQKRKASSRHSGRKLNGDASTSSSQIWPPSSPPDDEDGEDDEDEVDALDPYVIAKRFGYMRHPSDEDHARSGRLYDDDDDDDDSDVAMGDKTPRHSSGAVRRAHSMRSVRSGGSAGAGGGRSSVAQVSLRR